MRAGEIEARLQRLFIHPTNNPGAMPQAWMRGAPLALPKIEHDHEHEEEHARQ
jgi:hypothetical protein